MCVCVNEYTVLADLQTDWLERRKRIQSLVPFVLECCGFSVLISAAGHRHFCFLVIHSNVTSWTWVWGALVPLHLLGYWTWQFLLLATSASLFLLFHYFTFTTPALAKIITWYSNACSMFFCQVGSNSVLNYGAKYCSINNYLYLKKRDWQSAVLVPH